MAVNTQQSGTDSLPLAQGAVFGAVAFVVGYVITLILVAVAEADEFTDELIETAGWIYYNAQFADVTSSVDAGDFGEAESESFNIVRGDGFLGEGTSLDVPAIVYHLIPVLVLLGAGFAIARYVDAKTPQEGAIAGATIVIGTTVLAILGTFIFTVTISFIVEFSASPDLAEGILFVGIGFPLVFGAIGGAIAGSSNQ